MLHVDSSSNASGAGAGLILASPAGDVAGYALHFEFLAINNKAEYEALLAGLKVAREVGAQHLKVFSNSQLVVGHIRDEYETREENMKREARMIGKQAGHYIPYDDTLYKWPFSLPLLKCLHPSEADYTLRKVHGVIPVEFELPSLRVKEYNKDTNSVWLRANLDLIEGSRKCATVRMVTYRQRVTKYYNTRVKTKGFQVSDLVLRRVEVSQSIEQKKLSLNWKGSYQVDEVVRPEAYRLKQLDGTPLFRLWNLANLRMYYQ
uniref:Uncharacterized protein LOC105036537 n=1 Tax=Elaeis guineensis var. tenera TaxID=51953 RepID=A0A6I9QJL2_ELAGV|nr:uncharacterized protein LOC105036537 [Elaeis guineensis]